MTEKRFHIINDADNLQKYGIICKPVVVDNKTDKKYILALDLLDLLNTLHEENNNLVELLNNLLEENEELNQYILYLKSVLEDNEIWYTDGDD